jgi:hypothetical protein
MVPSSNGIAKGETMPRKLANKLPAADPVSWSTRLLRSRGFGVTPVPAKGVRYLSLAVRPRLVATHRDGRCVVVVLASPAERFGVLMSLLNDKAARSLLFAVDADYSVEVHTWRRDAAGQTKAEVIVVDADDFCPDGPPYALLVLLDA